MIKYNYKKASQLWDRLIDIIYDMPDYLDYTMRQCERRYFLRMLTRNDIKQKDDYLSYLSQYISDYNVYCNPDEIPELEKIALEIVLFNN